VDVTARSACGNIAGCWAFRQASPGDGRAVAELWLRSRRASIPAIPPPVHSDAEVRDYFEHVVLPKGETWVLESSTGDPVALLVLAAGWIEHLYVDPEWTGRGLGSRLVAQAKRLSPDGLELWTFASNAGARRFYERHEFIAVGSTDGDNEEGAPDVRYRWVTR
jgi:GNAT superfamily N-acetyltransferase